MYNYEKIAEVVRSNFSKGEEVNNKEIIEAVQKKYPEIPEGSILLADYCDNHKNKDPRSGKYHIFHKIDGQRGLYKVL